MKLSEIIAGRVSSKTKETGDRREVMSKLLNGWKRTKDENPDFVCRKCGSNDIQYRRVESSDGAYDDVNYKCFGCGRSWWFESSDY